MMNKMINFVFLLLFSSITAVLAQDNSQVPITSENAESLTLISEITFTTEVFRRFVLLPDGSMVAIAGDNGIQLYDLTTGEAGKQLVTEEYGAFIFNQEGNRLLFTTESGIQQLDLETDEVKTLAADLSGTLSLSNDEKLLGVLSQSCSVGGCEGEVAALDLESGDKVLSRSFKAGYVNGIALSPDSRFLAYAENSTGTWSMANQRGTSFPSAVVHVVDLSSSEDMFTVDVDRGVMGPMLFSPDSSHLVYSEVVYTSQFPEWGESAIHVMNLDTGEDDSSLELGSLAYSMSPDGRIIFTEGNVFLPGTVTIGGGSHLVSIDTGEEVFEQSGFSEVAFSPITTLTAVSGGEELESTLSIYDISTGNELTSQTVEDVDSVFSLIFSNNGALLAGSYVKDEKRTLLVWGIN